MSNKTPFEIRAELLAMATQHVHSQYYANMDLANKIFDKSLEAMKTDHLLSITEIVQFQTEAMKEMKALMPVMPSIDEVTKKATELYQFVIKKD